MEAREAKHDEPIEREADDSDWEISSSLEDDSGNEITQDEDENELTLPQDSYIPRLQYLNWKVVVHAWCTTPGCERFLSRKVRVYGLRYFYIESEHRKLRCRCCGWGYRVKFYAENVNVSIDFRTSHGMKSEKHNFRLPNSFKFKLPADWVSCEAKFTRVRMNRKLQHAVQKVMSAI